MIQNSIEKLGWLVLGAAFVVAIWLAMIMGITFDEAVNYVVWSAHGPFEALFNYNYPNNHILFTFINSLFVHDFFLSLHPQFLRTPNIIYTVATAGVVWHMLRDTNIPPHLRPWAILLIFFSSLITVEYMVLSRGYMLGTGLTLGGIWAWHQWPQKPLRAITCWALASWCVPTFGFFVPGILTAILLVNWRVHSQTLAQATIHIAKMAGRYLGITLLLYAPVFPSLIRNSSRFTDPELINQMILRLTNFGIFNSKNWEASFTSPPQPEFIWLIPTLVFISLALTPTVRLLFVVWKTPTSPILKTTSASTVLSLAGGALSYTCFALIFPLLGILNFPFYRNAVALTPMMALAFIIACRIPGLLPRPLQYAGFTFLTVNAALGVAALIMATPFNVQTDNLSEVDFKHTPITAITYADYSPSGLYYARVHKIPAYNVPILPDTRRSYSDSCAKQGLAPHLNLNGIIVNGDMIIPCIPPVHFLPTQKPHSKKKESTR